MKITKKQVEKFEEGCGNGFKFDVESYLTGNDKHLFKYISLGNNRLLRAGIEYRSDETGQIPVLSLSMWMTAKEDSELLVGSGKTEYITLYESQKRKNFKLLKEYSHKATDDYILKAYSRRK